MALMNLIVVDTETGGLDPVDCALFTVGVVALDPWRGPMDSLALEIKDDGEVHRQALEVNGIDPVALRARGLLPEYAVTRLETFVRHYVPEGRVVLAGHNVAFDAGFLRRLYRLAGNPSDYDAMYSHRLVDLHSWYMLLAMADRLPKTGGSLDEIAAALGVHPLAGRHTALGDALLAARCLHRILSIVSKPGD